jgi:hypothetical protein
MAKSRRHSDSRLPTVLLAGLNFCSQVDRPSRMPTWPKIFAEIGRAIRYDLARRRTSGVPSLLFGISVFEFGEKFSAARFRCAYHTVAQWAKSQNHNRPAAKTFSQDCAVGALGALRKRSQNTRPLTFCAI